MLKGTPNFRDLGGIPGHDGRPLRAGSLLRGGQLADLNAHDVDQAAKIIAGTARSMGVEVEA